METFLYKLIPFDFIMFRHLFAKIEDFNEKSRILSRYNPGLGTIITLGDGRCNSVQEISKICP